MKISGLNRRVRAAGRVPKARAVRRDRPRVDALEWVRDMAGCCARTTAIGNHSLLVENCTGILDFSRSRVLLNTPTGPLCALGSDLWLRDVRPGALIIEGRIDSVELPCKGGDAPDEG